MQKSDGQGGTMQRGYLSITLLMAACFFRTALSADLLFLKENIIISVLAPDTVKVQGAYFFTASDSTTITPSLYFPFPIDGLSHYPFFIQAVEYRTKNPLNFEESPQGILFSFTVANKDTVCIFITYKQTVQRRTGRYILLTTSSWGRLLGKSRYSIRIPSSYMLSWLSYRSDSVTVVKQERTYHFYRTKFIPDRDLIFTWSISTPENPPTTLRSKSERRHGVKR
jgi:hypothetical protein